MSVLPAPLYDDGQITIYCGDSREIAPLLDFDGLVIADGPYGIAHPTNYRDRRPWRPRRIRGKDGKYGGVPQIKHTNNYAPVHGDDEPFSPDYLLDIGAARILWGGNHFASRLPDSGGWLVWDKLRADDLDQATCELAWTDCVKGVRRFVHRWDGMLRDSERGAGQLVHPTQKPIALMVWAMSLRWTRGFTDILDPYMGSGPVVLAADKLGKRVIGIEIVREYCDITIERLHKQREAQGKVAPTESRPGQQIGLFAGGAV